MLSLQFTFEEWEELESLIDPVLHRQHPQQKSLRIEGDHYLLLIDNEKRAIQLEQK